MRNLGDEAWITCRKERSQQSHRVMAARVSFVSGVESHRCLGDFSPGRSPQMDIQRPCTRFRRQLREFPDDGLALTSNVFAKVTARVSVSVACLKPLVDVELGRQGWLSVST